MLRDSNGMGGTTSSRRGRVTSMSLWLNSKYGEVLDLGAWLTEGSANVQKPKLSNPSHFPAAHRERIKEENERLTEEYEEECRKQSKVTVSISPHEARYGEFVFILAGETFTQDDLAALRSLRGSGLSIREVLRLAPEIARMAEAPTRENAEEFVRKRDEIRAEAAEANS